MLRSILVEKVRNRADLMGFSAVLSERAICCFLSRFWRKSLDFLIGLEPS